MKKLFVRGKKGFTLIELLIVIAIIAILATIIILNVLSARAKANDSKVLSELNSAAKVASICLTEDGLLYSNYTAGPPLSGEFTTTAVSVVADKQICGSVAKSPGNWMTLSGIVGTGGTFAQPTGAYSDATKSDFNLLIGYSPAASTFATCHSTGCSK